MYHKVKNTLAGLGIVAAFLLGGVLLSEPLPAQVTQPAPATQAPELAMLVALSRLALDVAEAQAAAQARQQAIETAEAARSQARARSARVRLELGMPYYSFGAMLPRRRES